MSSGVTGTGNQVNSVCLSLLLQELIPTTLRIGENKANKRIGANCDNYQTRIDTPLSDENDLPGTTTILKSDQVANNDVAYRIETCGYNLGIRFAEYLMFTLPIDVKIDTVLDVMKLLCRELWKELYGKQMDSLRTNHRGTFVLIDNNFRLISNLSSPNGTSELLTTAKLYLQFPCGIISGVVKSFGIDANVSAEIKLFPTVEFSIQTPELS